MTFVTHDGLIKLRNISIFKLFWHNLIKKPKLILVLVEIMDKLKEDGIYTFWRFCNGNKPVETQSN